MVSVDGPFITNPKVWDGGGRVVLWRLTTPRANVRMPDGLRGYGVTWARERQWWPRGSESAVKTARRNTLIVGALGVVLVTAVAWRAARWGQPREYELKSAVVTRLDVQKRTGEIEFIHPRSGRTMTVSADRIPDDCEILVDGKDADLADVRVGDVVDVRGLVNPLDQSVRPHRVHVRRAVPATGPVTASPGGPRTP